MSMMPESDHTVTPYDFINPAEVPVPRGYKGGSGGGVVRNSDPQTTCCELVDGESGDTD